MSLVPFVVLLPSPEAASIAAKLAAKHNSLTTAGVLVSDGLSPAIPTKLRLKPGICSLAMPNQQIVEMRASSVRFYDEIFNQVAAVKPQKPLKVPDSCPSVAVVHREPLAWLVDAKQRNTFFTEIKRDPRWMVKGSSLVLYDAKKKVRSEVQFDNSFRVVEIKLSMNNKTITDWRYRYVADKDIPGIPTSAREVKGLPSRPNLPSKTDGKAVLLAQKVWRSVSRLEGRTVVQTNEDGTFQTTFKHGSISEKGPKGSWTLTETSLVIEPNSGLRKTVTSKFIDGLRAAGLSASPIAWYVLNRKVPYLDVFDQSEIIEIEKNVSLVLNGKSQAILSLRRRSNRIRMYIDPDSGDLGMISSDALDQSGNVISSSRMKVSYR